MRLGRRIRKLERVKAHDTRLCVFVGVPQNQKDIFKIADDYWKQNGYKYDIANVKGALPWPHYTGDEVKFLGVGTSDDIYFGYGGGVFNPETSHFVFLSDVGDLIKSHWREVQRFMNCNIKQREGLSLSDEAIKVLSSLARSE